jgi:uncharacterized protein YdhG (YjbR/CyaY superfamily)
MWDFVYGALEFLCSKRGLITVKSDERATQRPSGQTGFTDDERRAMKERAKELKDEQRQSANAKEAEVDLLAKIAEMPEADRTMAERLHALIKRVAPMLAPRTWYGMPAYAKDGNVVCFFQGSHKFKARYATLGFSDKAKLDEGDIWPTAYAMTRLDAEGEKLIAELVKKAVS